MAHFTKKIDGHIFSISRIFTIKGPMYHVGIQSHAASYFFMMENGTGEWKISSAFEVPPWIRTCEAELHTAIQEYIQSTGS